MLPLTAAPAETSLHGAQARERLRWVALPAAEPLRAGEAARRLLVDRRHDRAVHEQAVGALLRELREQLLGEPFTPWCDGGLGRDPVEVVVQLLRLHDLRRADEVRRPDGHDPREPLHEPLAGLAVADEELDLEVAPRARDEAR